MGFSYKPLFRLLVDRNMKKTDLHTEIGLSSATLAKLSKKETISGESMEKLCLYFRCQPGDLVEYEFPEPQVSNDAPDSGSGSKTSGRKTPAPRPSKQTRTKR